MSDPITSEIAHVERRCPLRGHPLRPALGSRIEVGAMIDLARAALRQRDIDVASYWLSRVDDALRDAGRFT